VIASHLVSLLVFAALVSAVFAALRHGDDRVRLRFGLKAFAAFVLSALVAAWLMSPFPG
jgi:hypothetical protein